MNLKLDALVPSLQLGDAQGKTQGQIIDWMTDIARDYLKNNTKNKEAL